MLDPSNKDSNDLPLTIRAVFIIGPDKKLKLSLNYPASVGRNMEEIMRCVDALQLSAKHSVVSLPLCLPDVPILPLLLPLPFSSLFFPTIFSLCISFSLIACFSGTALCAVLLTSIHCSRIALCCIATGKVGTFCETLSAKDAAYHFYSCTLLHLSDVWTVSCVSTGNDSQLASQIMPALAARRVALCFNVQTKHQ